MKQNLSRRLLAAGLATVVMTALTNCGRSDRDETVTVLEDGKPVKDAEVFLYGNSDPNPLSSRTDAHGIAHFKKFQKEKVVSVGVFVKGGRIITVLNNRIWPVVVRLTKARRQTVELKEIRTNP